MLPDHPKLTLDSLHETADSPVDGLVHRYPDKALFLRECRHPPPHVVLSHPLPRVLSHPPSFPWTLPRRGVSRRPSSDWEAGFARWLTKELATSVCPTYCMFCTRSYAVGADTESVTKKSLRPTRRRWEEAFAYMENQPRLHDIVVSGGDSYYLQPEQLSMIGERLIGMPNIRRFRFASKGLAVAPTRVLDETDGWVNALIDVSTRAKRAGKAVALHTHFNHPNEVSWITQAAAQKLLEAGVTVRNQTVLLRGVNDDVPTMSALIRKLADNNISPVRLLAGQRGAALPLPPPLPLSPHPPPLSSLPPPQARRRLTPRTVSPVLRLPVRHGGEGGAPSHAAADDPGPGGAHPRIDRGLPDAAVRRRPTGRRRQAPSLLVPGLRPRLGPVDIRGARRDGPR